MFICFWERERETEHNRGGTEREGDTELEVGSTLRAVSTKPDSGLELKNCDYDLSRNQMLNLLSHPGAPTQSF